MSAKDALSRFYQNELDELTKQHRPKRKNQKPEREVQTAVMAWLKANGFSMNIIEAKAVFSHRAGRYIHGQTAAGVSDLFGCTPDGLGCFIELKAPGKRSTLRSGQRAFLQEKITSGAFAAVVDSVDCLERLWLEFAHKRKIEPMLARNVLLKHLPAERSEEAFNPDAPLINGKINEE